MCRDDFDEWDPCTEILLRVLKDSGLTSLLPFWPLCNILDGWAYNREIIKQNGLEWRYWHPYIILTKSTLNKIIIKNN